MATEQVQGSAGVRAARERFVPRGVATTDFVVARAEGATLWDADGNEVLDFAGGIACQNLGHNPEAVVRAVHEQVDHYLHQCFMVGMYEPYVEVAHRLDALWPGESETKTLLVNSGAEAVENAVKIARAATGRPGVVVFDRAFHGRTNLTMAMTSKLVYKHGFGPLATDIYRVPAPYPYRGVSTEDALHGLELLFKQDVDPNEVACVVLEPVQGEGGFIPMPLDFPARLKELLDGYGILYVDDEIQSGVGRTGPVWAIEHYGVEPDLLVSGKSLGGGLPLAAVTGRAEVMDAPHIGGLGGTFAGNPVSCAAATVVLEELSRPEVLTAATRLGERLRAGLNDIQSRIDQVGDVRGLGPMLAIELVNDRTTKEPAAELVTRTIAEALERGLLLMGSGIFSNVIRFLPPLNIEDAQLDRGLTILEESLVAAGATR